MTAVRYSDVLNVRCQPELNALVDQAARRRGSKPSEYVRQALQAALRADGLDPASLPARDAGALYDSVEGQQRYALIEGDTIKFMSYHAQKPTNGDWRPVYHEDSEPCDPLTKWRLKPVAHIEADRVRVVFPVVDRSMEWA